MVSCITCGKGGKIYEKSGRLYQTKDGPACADCFVRLKLDVNKSNFLRVRVDIGDNLRKSQKKAFNKICENYDRHGLFDLLGFKYKIK